MAILRSASRLCSSLYSDSTYLTILLTSGESEPAQDILNVLNTSDLFFKTSLIIFPTIDLFFEIYVGLNFGLSETILTRVTLLSSRRSSYLSLKLTHIS